MQTNEPNGENGSTSDVRYSAETSNDADTDSSERSGGGPLHDLTAFQRDILRVIYEDGRPGLRIKDTLEYYYAKEVHHGRLYPNLDTLINKGLAKKEALDRRTNEYQITERGEREFEAHRKWEDEPLVDTDDIRGSNGGSQ